jgi:1,4-alpha-glucan branching enzyme
MLLSFPRSSLCEKRACPMIRKIFIETESGLVARVTFILPNSTWADAIYLVGDFNGWNHSSHPFQRGREGTWTLTLDLEVGRCYQFRYLHDGDWINDSQADGFVGNPHGSDNSLVVTDPKFKRYPDERNERRGGQNPALEIDDP